MATAEGVTENTTVVCRECGKLFKADEVVLIGDAPICKECEPAYRDRLGADESSYVSQTEEELLASDYQIDIGDVLSRSMETFQRNMGLMIGATLLLGVMMLGMQMIPWLNMILPLLLSGPLMGGFWLLVCDYLVYFFF